MILISKKGEQTEYNVFDEGMKLRHRKELQNPLTGIAMHAIKYYLKNIPITKALLKVTSIKHW